MTKEELEKEADKYADGWATPDLDSSFRVYMFEASKEGYLAGAEPREKRIAELEKENAELKAKNKWYSEQVCNKECAEVWGNLDKAKELLKDITSSYGSTDVSEAQLYLKIKKAELFLK